MGIYTSAPTLHTTPHHTTQDYPMSSETIQLTPKDASDWRGNVWGVLVNHQREDGEPPRFCVDDHTDHVHLLFKCGCPKNCPTRSYRIECTVEMLCDIVPRENMHIHENGPVEKPTAAEPLARLPSSICGGEHREEGCPVCCGDFSAGEEMLELPCGHFFHRGCIVPWLEKQNTCPTCRFELPSANEAKGKKPTVMVGEREESEGAGASSPPEEEVEESSSVLEDFLGLALGEGAAEATSPAGAAAGAPLPEKTTKVRSFRGARRPRLPMGR